MKTLDELERKLYMSMDPEHNQWAKLVARSIDERREEDYYDGWEDGYERGYDDCEEGVFNSIPPFRAAER